MRLDPQARAQSHRGVLRAGARLLVRGRRRAGETHVGSGSEGEQVQSLGQEVSGNARAGAPGSGAPALLVVAYLVAQAPQPTAVTVGRVTALRWRVCHPLPLWFEEGYAAVAAGEWDRLDALRLNWQVARGVDLDLDGLDRSLRSDEADAATAYALATTAVLLLDRWGGAQGLG